MKTSLLIFLLSATSIMACNTICHFKGTPCQKNPKGRLIKMGEKSEKQKADEEYARGCAAYIKERDKMYAEAREASRKLAEKKKKDLEEEKEWEELMKKEKEMNEEKEAK